MKLYIILDLVVICILALCTWHGFRRGLILGISGILSLFVALWGADLIANTYSTELFPVAEPFISGLVDKTLDTAQKNYDTFPIGDEVYSVSLDALGQIGMLSGAAEKLADELSEEFAEIDYRLNTAMTEKITDTFSFAVVAVIAFLLIVIVFAIITNLINLAFNLPGLKLLNEIGGAALGLAKGVIFALALAWALRFFGMLIPASVVEKTFLVKFFMNNNPIPLIFGI
ncbi:MAG: CvpA family protein [Oscillospiraceae bacterium]|jgi:uncharacterized membrane protein required for colicin V production|nr:CvpA family protein [Oscillospiraceae bacterium]